MSFFNANPANTHKFRLNTQKLEESAIFRSGASRRRCTHCGEGHLQDGGTVRAQKFYCAGCSSVLFPKREEWRGQAYADRCYQLIGAIEIHRESLAGLDKSAITRTKKKASEKYPEGDWRELIEKLNGIAQSIPGFIDPSVQ